MIKPILGMSRSISKSVRRPSLADAIFSKTQQRVFRLLFGQPDRSFYASELIKQAGTGSGAAQRELIKLEESGLAVVHRVGRQKHYQANPKSPLFNELRSIVSKTIALAEPIREALARLAPQIQAAFIFGSVAKGNDRAQSDIDLMVISDHLSYGEVFGALEAAGTAIGRPINPTLYSRAEFASRVKKRNAFVTRVTAQPRIRVIGSDHDFAARVVSKCPDMRNRSEYEGATDVDERLLDDLFAACRAVAARVKGLPKL